MRIVEYTSGSFERLTRALTARYRDLALFHKPFVDFYYTSRLSSKLYLCESPSGEILGTLGTELLPFEIEGGPVQMAMGTNFYSLQPGLGGILFMRWLRAGPVALEYGGSEDAHRLIQRAGWTYFHGIALYVLNHDFPAYGVDGWHRRAAKWAMRTISRRPLSAYLERVPPAVRGKIRVREEFEYQSDLIPTGRPFRLCLAPDIDYLAWRYNLTLPFVKYRLFRILCEGKTDGYVIINDGPRRLLVAQSDGSNAENLAWGILLSLLKAGEDDPLPRSALLACSHSEMAAVYERFGLRRIREDYPFAVGGKINLSADTSAWHVNFDWGDNGLLGPLPGQAGA